MLTTLEDLWYGNLCPHTDCLERTPQAKQLSDSMVHHYDALQQSLTEEQKRVFEKPDNYYLELNDLTEREIFVYGFRLGAKFILEIL